MSNQESKGKVIGEYYDGIYYDIIDVEDSPDYVLKLRDGQTYNHTGEPVIPDKDTPSEIKFTWDKALLILTNPWDNVSYYHDELGEHYYCIVYDFIWIDIWQPTIEDLFNTLASLLKPDDSGVDLLKSLDKSVND